MNREVSMGGSTLPMQIYVKLLSAELVTRKTNNWWLMQCGLNELEPMFEPQMKLCGSNILFFKWFAT
jgi:hypothetical protein